MQKIEDIPEMIEKYGNRKSCYKPFMNAIFYPLSSSDFIRTGFLEIAPTLSARDYKDPKCVLVGGGYKMSDEIEIVGRLDGYSAMDLGNRVYSIDGDTPSMHAHAADTLAKILVKQATDKGYAECKIGGVADLNYPSSSTRRGRVQEEGDVCPTLTTESQPSVIETRYRIRKLTPRECWRLMDFRDEDFDKAAEVNSNSQLYKQAGNSIVVACLEQIFMELF